MQAASLLFTDRNFQFSHFNDWRFYIFSLEWAAESINISDLHAGCKMFRLFGQQFHS